MSAITASSSRLWPAPAEPLALEDQAAFPRVAPATLAATPVGARTPSAPTGPDLPPMLFDDDWARTGKTMPWTSHAAADVSQAGLKEAKRRLLTLIRELEPVAGSHLNTFYAQVSLERGWKRLAFDSPRKRAAELAEDGYVEVVERSTADGNHMPEAIYALTPKGRAAL